MDNTDDIDELTPLEIGLRFAQQVTGFTIVDGPPPPGSPLAKLIDLFDRYDDDPPADELRKVLDEDPAVPED